ncbi:MAG: SpoIIE family protein phosphatase, partial [Cyanobacteriota bacterium]
INWKQKFNDTNQQLDEIKLAYNNLLHDVLSFNELLSKKDSTTDILKLVLRLAMSIIDFKSGVIFAYEAKDLKPVHHINLSEEFEKQIKVFLNTNKYENIIIKQRSDIISLDKTNTKIIMPLITKQQAVGIVDINVEKPISEIKSQDLDLLWILCSIAAIEFESIEMSNRSELLSLMLSSLEKINSEDKLDNLLYLILNNLKQIVPASSYLLILRDKLLDVSGDVKYCLPEIHMLDETCIIVDECIEKKETIFIKKLSLCENCKLCTESYLHEDHDGSLMLVPLYKGDLSYGVITIYDKDNSGGIFSQYNRHIIEIFAKQATIAINNAILYDQQKKTNLNLANANEELSNKNEELDNKKNELIENQKQLENALNEINLKNKILSKEIESAGVVQNAILSKLDHPAGIDFYVEYKPHHSIGGDFFGITKINEHKSVIYIGDVSGKGVPAAIMTGLLKNEIGFIISKYKNFENISPGMILSEVNSSTLTVFKVTEQFCSLWCGIIDTQKQTLLFASAGHDYPLLIKDKVSFMDSNNGPIIGLFDTMNYKDLEIDLSLPAKLFLYTDGITDQETRDGKRLNRLWLLTKIEQYKDYTPETLCKTIVNEVLNASDGTPQHDDMLAIVLSLKP